MNMDILVDRVSDETGIMPQEVEEILFCAEDEVLRDVKENLLPVAFTLSLAASALLLSVRAFAAALDLVFEK